MQDYIQMKLHPKATGTCTTVLHWGVFCNNSLHIGVVSSPDLFQWALDDLFVDMQNALIYFESILILSHRPFKNHLHIIDWVLQCLDQKPLP